MKFSGGVLALGTSLLSAAPSSAVLVAVTPASYDAQFESMGIRSITNVPARVRRAGINTNSTTVDWDNIQAGKSTCEPVAVICMALSMILTIIDIGVSVRSFFFDALRKDLPPGVA
ncbi:hypothetical protein BJ878DRAFT_568770 [Calycina marina]|uniref:Uncharacterized protein n=1 Tax=Calycina marina TaxID=1763456 RepID=A0A9P7Z002_9HELO|nr:hypothetical protein BJ878DRAFT_568770 [Calycina marina]